MRTRRHIVAVCAVRGSRPVPGRSSSHAARPRTMRTITRRTTPTSPPAARVAGWSLAWTWIQSQSPAPLCRPGCSRRRWWLLRAAALHPWSAVPRRRCLPHASRGGRPPRSTRFFSRAASTLCHVRSLDYAPRAGGSAPRAAWELMRGRTTTLFDSPPPPLAPTTPARGAMLSGLHELQPSYRDLSRRCASFPLIRSQAQERPRREDAERPPVPD